MWAEGKLFFNSRVDEKDSNYLKWSISFLNDQIEEFHKTNFDSSMVEYIDYQKNWHKKLKEADDKFQNNRNRMTQSSINELSKLIDDYQQKNISKKNIDLIDWKIKKEEKKLEDTFFDTSMRDYVEENIEFPLLLSSILESDRVSVYLDYFTLEYLNYLDYSYWEEFSKNNHWKIPNWLFLDQEWLNIVHNKTIKRIIDPEVLKEISKMNIKYNLNWIWLINNYSKKVVTTKLKMDRFVDIQPKKSNEVNNPNKFYEDTFDVQNMLNDRFWPEYYKYDNKKFDFRFRSIKFKTLTYNNWKTISVYKDIDLHFYRVVSWDNSTGVIRRKLRHFPELAHVSQSNKQTLSLNIESKHLRIWEIIPIWVPRHERVYTNWDFAKITNIAINQLLEESIYSGQIKKLIDLVWKDNLIKLSIAVAKIESGWYPIWSQVLNRFEPRHRRWSLSHFHVFMKWDGKTVLDELKMSPWQLMNPINWVKLFFWFLLKKFWSVDNLVEVFKWNEWLFDVHLFAIKYNWKYYKKEYSQSINKNFGLVSKLFANKWIDKENEQLVDKIIKEWIEDQEFSKNRIIWLKSKRLVVSDSSWVAKIRILQRLLKRLWILKERDTWGYWNKTIAGVKTLKRILNMSNWASLSLENWNLDELTVIELYKFHKMHVWWVNPKWWNLTKIPTSLRDNF